MVQKNQIPTMSVQWHPTKKIKIYLKHTPISSKKSNSCNVCSMIVTQTIYQHLFKKANSKIAKLNSNILSNSHPKVTQNDENEIN